MTPYSRVFRPADSNSIYNGSIRELYAQYPNLLHVAAASTSVSGDEINPIILNPALVTRRDGNDGFDLVLMASPIGQVAPITQAVALAELNYRMAIERVPLPSQRETTHLEELPNRGETVLQLPSPDIPEQLPSSTLDIYSMDERAHATLDICSVSSDETSNRDIGHTVESKEKKSPRVSPKVGNLLLMVLLMAVTSFLTNPNDFPPPGDSDGATVPVNILELLFGPSQYKAIFYHMMLNTTGFLVSMGAVIAIMWPHPFRKVLTFVLVIMIVDRLLVVDQTLSRFSVIVRSCHISGTMVVCLSALAFIVSVATTAWLSVKLIGKFLGNSIQVR